MIHLYFQPLAFRIALACVFLTAGASGTVAFILKAWLRAGIKEKAANIFCEAVCLAFTFSSCLMCGVYLQYVFSNTVSSGFFTQTRAVFPVLLAVSLIVQLTVRRKVTGATALMSSLLMSTWAESLFGSHFPFAVMLSGIILCIRNIFAAASGMKSLRRGISILSIKTAIDTLPTGILICETDGRPLLVNTSFKRFAEKIGGSLDKGGNAFWKYLYFGEWANGASRHSLGSCLVAVMSDSAAYMLSRDTITVKGHMYYQTTVTDITQRWSVNNSLILRHEQLSQRSRELTELLENIDGVCRDREIVAARGRMHDILGQRITIFQRYMNSGALPSKQTVSELVDDLSERMRHENMAPPEKRLSDLRETLESVGVTVSLSGELPENSAAAEVFFKVVRESTTNAVRHGFATRISVAFSRETGCNILTVTDNGTPPEGEIHYGTGLSGLKRLVAEAGGVFEIAARPHFTVKAVLPHFD